MRNWRGSVALFLATSLALSSTGSARAQLAVVTTPGEPPAISHAELAYAEGQGIPVTWLSLRVERGPAAVVVALPPGAVADSALDAWFSALEATTSPNVLVPRGRSNCGQTGSFVHVAWPRSAGVAAAELSLQTPEDVEAALDEQGLATSAKLPAAERYLLWSWPASATPQTTRTLRIAGGAAPLALLPGSAFPVLVSAVTRGSVALPSELSNGELPVTFVARERPTSDYLDRLQDWLVARPEPLLETRARGPLFDWAIYDDGISLASLVSSYANRAGKELPELDADTCAEQLRGLRQPEAPSASACGNAADASLALAAAGPELSTIQRFVVSSANGFAPTDAVAGGAPSTPLLRAQLLDDSACNVPEQPPLMAPPGGTPVHNTPGPNGTTTVVVEETVAVDDGGHSEVSCGGSPPPQEDDSYGSDGCGADTSSSSQTNSSDSCSGDSSTSSSTDGSTDSGCSSDTSSTDGSTDSGCSSDTSSTDGSSDSGCGADSSSSSSDSSDTSCDGGSSDSSGYDGDTCTGAAAPGAERAEKAQAGLSTHPGVRRPRRLKTSLWSMAFAAFILPIRRRKRAPGAGG
jgi:hypothetical protein